MRSWARTAAKTILSARTYEQLTALRRRSAITLKYGINPSLEAIGSYFLTDKYDRHHSFAGLSYLDIYERYFEQFRNKKISVLEIGVKQGASLRTWKSYFNKGSIFGIDIDPSCRTFEENRIRIDIGSQDDTTFLKNCFGPDRKFDIIIDDGSHINEMTLASFHHLFKHRLSSGGIYIIEDLRCSYEKLQTEQNILEIWPGMKYNDNQKSFDNDRQDMDRFFLGKIDELDHRTGNIRFIHFWSMTCIIEKV